MNQSNTVIYATRGHTYEIRQAVFDGWHVVQAFENGKPASHRYGVTLETEIDMRLQNRDSAIAELIDILKSDLSRNG